MIDFIERVIAWNKLRTPRTPYPEFRLTMLYAEVDELASALADVENNWAKSGNITNQTIFDSEAHVVKETFDVIFIAIGSLWVMGLDAKHIAKVLDMGCDSNDTRDDKFLDYGEKGIKGLSFKPAEPLISAYLQEIQK